MIISWVFNKVKLFIAIIVIVAVIIIVYKLFKSKSEIIRMLKEECNLANKVSKNFKIFSDLDASEDVDSPIGKSLASFLFSGDSDTNNEKARKGRDKVRRKNSKISKNKNEEICRQILEDHFDDYFPTCRPKFLTNPETGKPLELDGYNASLNLAFEYNGIHHYKYPNPFHKTEEEYIKQIERDNFKREKCKELGIDLIEIHYKIPSNKLEIEIMKQLKSFGKLK